MSGTTVIRREEAVHARPRELAPLPVGDAGVLSTPGRGAALEEIARARLEGHRLGLEAGRAEARAEADDTLLRARGIALAWRVELARLEQTVADELLELTLALARQVVRSELEQRPESIRAVLTEALRALAGSAKDLRVRVNPEDTALVRPCLEEELPEGSWRVLEDPAVERGGCRVETAESTVDATLRTRWTRALALLGGRHGP